MFTPKQKTMKTKFALIYLLALIATACSSDDSSPYKCSDCVDTPEASSDWNSSGKGIYKGLVVGSSGTMKFNIANDGTYSATLTIDGVTYELTTEDTYNSEVGFIGTFYGKKNTDNDIVIEFYSSYDGSVYYVDSATIPGHDNVTVEVYKETSTALVMVFEGTYKGDASGTFNMVVQGTSWNIVARDNDDPAGDNESYFEGTLDGSDLVCDCGDIVVTGSINTDATSGHWEAGTDSGSWSGKRTL